MHRGACKGVKTQHQRFSSAFKKLVSVYIVLNVQFFTASIEQKSCRLCFYQSDVVKAILVFIHESRDGHDVQQPWNTFKTRLVSLYAPQKFEYVCFSAVGSFFYHAASRRLRCFLKGGGNVPEGSILFAGLQSGDLPACETLQTRDEAPLQADGDGCENGGRCGHEAEIYLSLCINGEGSIQLETKQPLCSSCLPLWLI